MRDAAELFTIGQVARQTELPVRTIRFWSDAGVLPPTDRSDGGYRLYDAEAVARLDLIRTLRELGLGLNAIRQLLRHQTTVRDVAAVHVQALDVQIRSLRLQRAVLQTVAKRTSTIEELALMHSLARLSAQERQRMLDQFVERAFAGIDQSAPGAGIARAMRQLPAELPDDPTAEQVDAWLELAELVQDSSFEARVRQMAVDGANADAGRPFTGSQGQELAQRVPEHVLPALAARIAPESAEAKTILSRVIPPGLTANERQDLANDLDRFADARVERYWQLLGILNGWQAVQPQVPAFAWLIAALRANA